MNLNDINFSPIKTIGNNTLEAEKLVSMFFNGEILPNLYSLLVSNISSLPDIFLAGETSWNKDFEEINSILKNKKYDIFLDESSLKKIYENKDKKFQRLMRSIKFKADVYFNEILRDYKRKEDEDFEKKFLLMDMVDISTMGKIIDNSAPEASNVPEIIYKMKEISEKSSFILQIMSEENDYKLRKIKIPKKIEDFKIFFIDMQSYLRNVENEAIIYTFTLSTCINNLQQIIPKDSFDPFKEDVFFQFFSLLKKPDSFYNKSKKGELSGNEIGSYFNDCYPEYYQLNLEKFLQSYNEIDFNNQEIIKTNFGV